MKCIVQRKACEIITGVKLQRMACRVFGFAESASKITSYGHHRIGITRKRIEGCGLLSLCHGFFGPSSCEEI